MRVVLTNHSAHPSPRPLGHRNSLRIMSYMADMMFRALRWRSIHNCAPHASTASGLLRAPGYLELCLKCHDM